MTRKLYSRACETSSLSVLSLILAIGAAGSAQAQTGSAAGTSPPSVKDTDRSDDDAKDIIVTGSRKAEEAANKRKKNAKTATDSLVADDVGSFPDRNVNEALSRLPGVALNRNEFGEGDSISVRGNGPDLTRVELDGIGVQGSNGLSASRGADLRELPAELIKSVDVVKGATADMTEGSLGGSVQIQTRSGLDFAKPFFSIRSGVQQNSLGRKWTPDFNSVATHKFLNGRLGVIVSGNFADIQNNGHSYQNTISGRTNYARLFDFDQSPDKTFAYNLNTLGTDAADVPFNAFTLETPRTLLTKSAAAQTKAQCVSTFAINPASTQNQRAQRILEQQSCLNQWNDYTPSLIRNVMSTQRDRRYSYDGRLDFKVSSQLTLFAKGTVANRKVHDQFRTHSPISGIVQNAPGTFVDSLTGSPRIRSVSPTAPAGYFLFDPQYGLTSNAAIPTLGNVLNVVPGSVVVDDRHNVTAMQLTNNAVTVDQIENTLDVKTRYMQGGATFRSDRVDIDAMVGMTKATSSRTNLRTARSYTYGNAALALQPNGLWDIELPAGYDESDVNNFVQLTAPRCVGTGIAPTCIGQNAVAASANGPATPAYTVGQMPLTTPSFGTIFRPSATESSERIGKIDLTYRTEDFIAFIPRIKYGAMYRRNTIQSWAGGGYTPVSAVGTFGQPGYVPAVVVPTANVSGTYRACQPTAGSSAPGGLPCNFGFVPSTNPSAIRSGVDTLTPQALRDLFAGSLEAPDSAYFGDLPNRGNLPAAWPGIRTDILFQGLGGGAFTNFDCLKQCLGSDGKMYDQPLTRTQETIVNLYGMFDFAQRLPFGIEVEGNVGLRAVYANVKGTGFLTINTVRVTSLFDPANPNAPAGITTQNFQQNTSASSKSWDWLPTYNAAFWGFDRSLALRLYAGKTVARPSIGNLLPSGTCTIDERTSLNLDGGDGDDPFGCSGRVGNPGLRPFTAWNYNVALEWYPNKDTVLSATVGRLDVRVGGAIGDTRTGFPFAGSDQNDPITGRPLSALLFNYPTWKNGPGYKRDIYEFSAKSAFTFLPWLLRNTGIDANLSFLSSKASDGTRDPSTGDIMSPPGQSKYYLNTSLWYDDGKLNLRVAYQRRTSTFNCISPCGGNAGDINYPGENWSNVRLVSPGYNPGVALFNDATQFIDMKASYNITKQVQVYVEGRNLTRQVISQSTGDYQRFADDIPRITTQSYGGRRILVGGRIAFGRR